MIGAGVVGLGVGWRLVQAGCAVDLFDAGTAGRGASWAAAGMLAAGVETEPGEEGLLALTRASQAMWPGFAEELRAVTGIDPDLREEGTLVLALTRDDLARLRANVAFQERLGIELRWLGARELREREPFLRPGIAGAVLSPHDHQVDNRALVTALVRAFTAAGGRLHEASPVEAVVIEGGRVTGVRAAERCLPADAVLLAAGAWSRRIQGIPPEALPPVRPIKGQMLALRMDPAAPLLRHVVWAPKVYLVPRRNGRLIVGATVEERGFDATLTAGGVLALLESAWRALPAIEELPIEEMWVGFRPGSPDDAPIIGPTPVAGLTVATGHHRNGILLAPITIEATARLVLTGERPPEIRPFGLERFARHGSRAPAMSEEASA
ncbi:glycine oxidase ThiO [Benzoatithermus flavus]|uniref:glycine oxidase ThiO n=1 Tax=Benzoatithermus flavus TaxID=3108223 RepID=UPI003AB05C34